MRKNISEGGCEIHSEGDFEIHSVTHDTRRNRKWSPIGSRMGSHNEMKLCRYVYREIEQISRLRFFSNLFCHIFQRQILIARGHFSSFTHRVLEPKVLCARERTLTERVRVIERGINAMDVARIGRPRQGHTFHGAQGAGQLRQPARTRDIPDCGRLHDILVPPGLHQLRPA